MKPLGPLRVIAGNANRPLAEKIASFLEMPLSRAQVARFPDEEIEVKIIDDVRGADVFVVQPTSPPVNDHLMELLILVDCLRRASAGRITAVIPYYGYARQDRKDEGRVPVTAKLVANMMVAAGVNRVLAMDLHANQIQGFFDVPLDHIYASKVFIETLRPEMPEGLVIVAPDLGSVKMAHAYAKRLGAGLAVIDKRRISGTETEAMNFIGSVEGRPVLIVDDMISTAGSICEASRVTRDHGATEVRLLATHGLLAGPAIGRLQEAPVQEVLISDTVNSDWALESLPTLRIISVAGLLGEAIMRVHESRSVSSLFL